MARSGAKAKISYRYGRDVRGSPAGLERHSHFAGKSNDSGEDRGSSSIKNGIDLRICAKNDPEG